MSKVLAFEPGDEVRVLSDAEFAAVNGGTSSFIVAVANAALKAVGQPPLTKKGDPDLPGLGGLPPY